MTNSNDSWRLKYHLMPPKGWLNDPNGLCFFKGSYHIFYQYSPEHVNGGLKYWGHYKSKDLLSWEDLGIFLKPDKDFKKSGAYSGSAIVHNDKLYIFYTGNVKEEGDFDYIHNGRQHNTVLAVSSDAKTIDEELVVLYNKDYPDDMTLHVRDPKVFEYENKFYMILGARTDADKGVALIFESDNLYNWSHINTLGSDNVKSYMWECPDLFLLDGTWFLMLSPQGTEHEKFKYQNVYSCGYFTLTGDFRDSSCTLNDYTEINKGFDFYAPQTFEHKNRRLLVAWAGMPDADYLNPTVDFGWQHALSSVLEVKNINNKLSILPVKELDLLFDNGKNILINTEFKPYILKTKKESAFNITLSEIDSTKDFSIEFFNTMKLAFDAKNKELSLYSTSNDYGRDIRFLAIDFIKNIKILIDSSMLEIFINDGLESFTTRFYPTSFDEISFNGNMSALIKKLK